MRAAALRFIAWAPRSLGASGGACGHGPDPQFLLIDGESHRADDCSGMKERWLKGDEYDITIGRFERKDGQHA